MGAAITGTPTNARAAGRRIALIHAEPELGRSVELALYPWDIKVVEIQDAPPEGTSPTAPIEAQAIAKRYEADVVAWIASGREAPTFWFFDASNLSLHSRPLPALPANDAAELAAVALTLKTFVRSAPWQARLPVVASSRAEPHWETRLELDAMARVPLSGATGEPRLGLWASVWRGTPRLMWGAALGASAGLGMTFDDGASRGTLQDIDVRADLRSRIRLAWHLVIEPRLGASAHVERAQVTTTIPATSDSRSRVNSSIDAGLFFGWEATEWFAWSIGIEALESLRYQRWLSGGEVVFAPSPLWIQAGSSLAWSFR